MSCNDNDQADGQNSFHAMRRINGRSQISLKWFLGTFLLVSQLISAATLTWDAPVDSPTPVAYFKVYQLGSNNLWSVLKCVTNATTTTFTNGPGVKIGITAVSADGWESDMATSDNPSRPLRIRLTLQSASDPAGPWSTLTNMVAEFDVTESERRFFKNSLTRLP